MVGTTGVQAAPTTTAKQPSARTNTAGMSGSRRSLPGTASPLPMMFLGAFALFGAAGFVRMIRTSEN